MAFSDLTPVLITTKHNTINEVIICNSPEQLEKRFKKECKNYGVVPTNINYEDGYMQLEDGTNIYMAWADKLGGDE